MVLVADASAVNKGVLATELPRTQGTRLPGAILRRSPTKMESKESTVPGGSEADHSGHNEENEPIQRLTGEDGGSRGRVHQIKRLENYDSVCNKHFVQFELLLIGCQHSN